MNPAGERSTDYVCSATLDYASRVLVIDRQHLQTNRGGAIFVIKIHTQF